MFWKAFSGLIQVNDCVCVCACVSGWTLESWNTCLTPRHCWIKNNQQTCTCTTCWDKGVSINPRRACAARVTVVGSVCVCFVYVPLHVIVSVFCLAILRIPPLHVHFISVCAFSKTRFISACSDWHTALRCQVLRQGFAL